MGCFEIAFAGIAGIAVILTLIVGAIAAMTRSDLHWIASKKISNPSYYYSNSKQIFRFNGPICVVGSAAVLLITIVEFIRSPELRLLMVVAACLFAPALWLTIRWSRRAWRN